VVDVAALVVAAGEGMVLFGVLCEESEHGGAAPAVYIDMHHLFLLVPDWVDDQITARHNLDL
jgi:hypothetical protein